jgi:hypothetical protein
MNFEEQAEKRREKFEATRDMICSMGNKGHDWIPVSWNIGPDSKHVATLMCGRCFCNISINDGYEFGAKPTYF